MLWALKNKRGFTLIELVIIIILLGILAAIAIPRYVDLRDNAVRAAAQAILNAGRAAVQLDFSDQIVNTGGYTNTLTNDTTKVPGNLNGQDVNDLENALKSSLNYPPNGPYDSPSGEGFRWWLVTQGINWGGASPPAPPVIDGGIDLTCVLGDAWKGANDDCKVSRL